MIEKMVIGLVVLAIYLTWRAMLWFLDEREWFNTQAFPWPAKRLECDPIMSPVETFWDCGAYGILRTDSEEVWRFSKPESKLWLKVRGSEVRIVGIATPFGYELYASVLGAKETMQ